MMYLVMIGLPSPNEQGRLAKYLLAASIGAIQQSKALQAPDTGRVDIDYAD